MFEFFVCLNCKCDSDGILATGGILQLPISDLCEDWNWTPGKEFYASLAKCDLLFGVVWWNASFGKCQNDVSAVGIGCPYRKQRLYCVHQLSGIFNTLSVKLIYYMRSYGNSIIKRNFSMEKQAKKYLFDFLILLIFKDWKKRKGSASFMN